MKYRVVIHYDKMHHKRYMKLFNCLNHNKIKSIGSIVMMKDELYWHDFLMDSCDFIEFYEHFKGFQFDQININHSY